MCIILVQRNHVTLLSVAIPRDCSLKSFLSCLCVRARVCLRLWSLILYYFSCLFPILLDYYRDLPKKGHLHSLVHPPGARSPPPAGELEELAAANGERTDRLRSRTRTQGLALADALEAVGRGREGLGRKVTGRASSSSRLRG